MSEAEAIYPHEKLLICEGVVITPVPPRPSNTPVATLAVRPTRTRSPSPTATHVVAAPAASSSPLLGVGVLLTVVLILIGIMLPGVSQSDKHRRVSW